MRKLVVRVVWWLSKSKDKDDDKIKTNSGSREHYKTNDDNEIV